MASAAEVANDLSTWAVHLRGTGHDRLVVSLIRGQAKIRELLSIIQELEEAAEQEAQKYERYVSGDDLHG